MFYAHQNRYIFSEMPGNLFFELILGRSLVNKPRKAGHYRTRPLLFESEKQALLKELLQAMILDVYKVT